MDKWVSRGKAGYLAFLDLRAAFDTVPREELWKALRKKGTPPKLTRAIKSMFDRVEGVVRMNGETSGTFLLEKGVKQGDSLSPLLFVIFMDEVLKVCKARTEKSFVGMWKLRPVSCQALAYADDVVLIADSVGKLQNAVTEWTETLRERGMEVNKDKSQVMMVARTDEQVSPITIDCGGQLLEQVEAYVYLGTTIHQTGKLQGEIRNRVKKATAAYYSLSNCLFGKREVERRTKTRVYNAILEPILLYGSESWTVAKNDLSSVNAVQMKCLRRIAGKTRWDRVRNERIREQLDQEPVLKRLEDRQLSWYGHVSRMPENRKTRQFLEAKPQGKRPVGRPRTTWEEVVEQTAARRGKTMGELRSLAADRDRYRQWIRGQPLTLRRRH